jgi:hypothetical protein
MQRAGRNGVASLCMKSPASPAGSERGSNHGLRIADLSVSEIASIRQEGPDHAGVPSTGSTVSSELSTERLQRLAQVIRQRIDTRLPGRVRNLVVRIGDDMVVLEGECSTYYTKQLAQHAALGVLDDETLENSIVVTIGR